MVAESAALIEVVKGFHTALVSDIGEILSQIQYQDVVRQRMERASVAIAQRNKLLLELPQSLQGDAEAMTGLAARLTLVLDEYVASELRHAPCDEQHGGLPNIELF